MGGSERCFKALRDTKKSAGLGNKRKRRLQYVRQSEPRVKDYRSTIGQLDGEEIRCLL